MNYKDMTFCPGPCGNYNCHRHKCHVDEAWKDGGYLQQHPYVPVAWFVEMPDCKQYLPLPKKAA